MIATIPGYPPFPYSERVPGSPIYSFSRGMSRVERTFKTAWANRAALATYLLGYPKIVNAGGDSYISRITPDKILDITNPAKAFEPWLFASQVVRMAGKGETGLCDTLGVAEYQEAELTVAYEPRTYHILSDAEMIVASGTPDESSLKRYVTRFQKPSAEFVQLPRGCMRWVDGTKPKNKAGKVLNGTAVDYASARLIPSMELTITWHEVPFVPEAAIDFVGCVNYLPFSDGVRKPYPSGTLLLMAAEIKPYRTASGVFVQDITYRMKYQDPQNLARGFNYFMRFVPDAGDNGKLIYEKITENGLNDYIAIIHDGIPGSPYQNTLDPLLLSGTSRSIYAYADFKYLFRIKYSDTFDIVGQL